MDYHRIDLIDIEIEGDTYFPEFDESLFSKELDNEFDGDISYTYLTYTRIHHI